MDCYAENSLISITNSSGDILGESGPRVAASLAFYGITAGRRLQGKSIAVPIPGPSAGASSGVHALGTKEEQNATACHSHSWLLPLLPGQNVFAISVGSVGQVRCFELIASD